MGRKKNDAIPKSDFDIKESQDLLSFDSEADLGECITSFNFCDNADANSNTSSDIKPAIAISNNTESQDLFDNRIIPIANGATPILDGEIPDVKRTYTLRASTVRKLNELKGIHPDINACVSTIVDRALEHYYKYITEEGGIQ